MPYSATNALILPSAWGLGAATAAVPPSTYHWPTDRDWLVGTATSLRDLVAGGPDALSALLNPPGALSTRGLVTVVESAAGGDLGKIIAGLITAELPAGVSEAVSMIVDNMVDLLVDAGSQAVTDLIGEALQAVPVLGAVVKALFAIVVWIVEAAEGYSDEECRQWADQVITAHCNKVARLAAPIGTGAGNQVTPADVFRVVAYRIHDGGGLPLSTASLYVLMCGDVAAFSRNAWAQFQQKTRNALGPGYGLPLEARQRLWSLINGVCTAVRNPDAVSYQGDQGRALFPLISDLLLRHHERFKGSESGRWNLRYAQLLSFWLTSRYAKTPTCDGDDYRRDCGLKVELGKPFEDITLGYLRTLQNPPRGVPVLLRGDGTWAPMRPMIGGVKRGMLRISRQRAEKTAADVRRILAAGRAKAWTPGQKAAVFAGTLAAGYLGLTGYKLISR